MQVDTLNDKSILGLSFVWELSQRSSIALLHVRYGTGEGGGNYSLREERKRDIPECINLTVILERGVGISDIGGNYGW